MRSRRVLFPAIAIFFIWAWSVEAGELTVEDPWVMLPPPQSVAAAFMKIHNDTDKVVVLVGATSPQADRVEIHQSLVSDGVASMEELKEVSIPAGETLVLAPKGTHLMLFEPKGLEEGGQVTFELDFKPERKLTTQAEVRRMGPARQSHEGHHSHH